MNREDRTSLRFTGVRKSFVLPGGKAHRRQVLRGVDLTVMPGEMVGLVGESGCGKSTLGRLAVGLLRPDEGSVEVPPGIDLATCSRSELTALRPSLQLIFQDPFAAFDPRLTLARSILPMVQRVVGCGPEEARQQVAVAFERVDLPLALLDRKPARVSGGQLQRAAIVRAAMARPTVLVADEIVSALDARTTDEVLAALGAVDFLNRCVVLFISHDLAAVASVCDHIAVMGDGVIVESGTTASVLRQPAAAQTRALLDAVPKLVG